MQLLSRCVEPRLTGGVQTVTKIPVSSASDCQDDRVAVPYPFPVGIRAI
jgi:hypothetical protein